MNLIALMVTTATRKALIILASLAAIAGETVTAAESNSPSAPEVIVIRAKNSCFSFAIRVTGFLVTREQAVVFLDIPGYKVSEVLVGEGDRVNSGQTLARLTRLAAEGPDPSADRRPMTMNLKAPAAGVVARSTAVVGATASPTQNEPLFRIAVDNGIELEAEVPSVYVPALKVGQPASVDIQGRELVGRVRLLPAVIDPTRQLGRARVSLERDPSLRFGMFAQATIEAERSCGISVPTLAIHHGAEGTSVARVRENVIELRPVQVGLHSDTATEIRGGISEGDMIVANVGGSLHVGDKVKPILADDARIGR
jgi:HlyD family secretion protein